jgi:hypothetical protein
MFDSFCWLIANYFPVLMVASLFFPFKLPTISVLPLPSSREKTTNIDVENPAIVFFFS